MDYEWESRCRSATSLILLRLGGIQLEGSMALFAEAKYLHTELHSLGEFSPFAGPVRGVSLATKYVHALDTIVYGGRLKRLKNSQIIDTQSRTRADYPLRVYTGK